MRILVADDHAVVRHGIEMIVKREFPDAFIEQADSAAAMLKAIMKSTWDVVISDHSMPGKTGLEALPEIKKIQPRLPVLILTMHPEEVYAAKAFKAGAAGFLNKEMAAEELVNAIHRVLAGKKYITASVAEKLAGILDAGNDKRPHDALTSRELTILQLFSEGKTIHDIALSLSIAASTVSSFRAKILSKLGLKTNGEMIRYALENKLV